MVNHQLFLILVIFGYRPLVRLYLRNNMKDFTIQIYNLTFKFDDTILALNFKEKIGDFF